MNRNEATIQRTIDNSSLSSILVGFLPYPTLFNDRIQLIETPPLNNRKIESILEIQLQFFNYDIILEKRRS